MKTQIAFGTKLMAGFAVMLALTLILSYASLTSLGSMMDSFDTTTDNTARKIVLANEIKTDGSDLLAWHRGLLLYAFEKDAARMESSKQMFYSKADAMEKTIARIAPLILDPQAKDAVAGIQMQIAGWRSIFAESAQLCDAGKPEDAARMAADRVQPVYQAMTRGADLVTQIESDRLQADRSDAADQYAQCRWIASALIGLSIAAAAIILLLVRRSSGNLRQIALELSQGAEQVAGAAGQVAAASQSLAQGASEQAASLQQTSASSEEMSSMTRRTSENAKSAASLMVRSVQLVDTANGTLGHMVQSMNEINTSSDKISKIIKVIDEIAFQTNILALNAAVEAARAGEAGMGFAVVADEVRNLAQRSAQAAKDTAALIEDSISKSGEGRTRLDEVAKSINAITESARQVKELVDEVSLGSEEQAHGIEQVSKAVAQMQEVTQKTAASAEESAAAGEELSAQADTTRSVVGRLQALVGGVRERGGTAVARSGKPTAALRPRENHGLAALTAAVEHAHPVHTANRTNTVPVPVPMGRSAFPLEDGF